MSSALLADERNRDTAGARVLATIQRHIEETARVKQQMEEWFNECDRLLDLHRSKFVLGKPSVPELEWHKFAIGACLQCCRTIATKVVAQPFGDSELLARLQIRIRQLEDAYNTFHDPNLSDDEAERILSKAFPE